MKEKLEILLEEVLPDVSGNDDPCINRLIEAMKLQYNRNFSIYLKPCVKGSCWEHHFVIFLDIFLYSDDEILESLYSIGEELSQQYSHAHWLLARPFDENEQSILTKSILQLEGVHFACIDKSGFLCVEYAADSLANVESIVSDLLSESVESLHEG